jgi:hypothetical protein
MTLSAKGREWALASIFAIFTMPLLPKPFCFSVLYTTAERQAKRAFRELTLARWKQQFAATME